MSVLRVKKTENFVILHKGALENPNLSFKAKGLWAYCMSRPDNWEFHVSHLATVSLDGEDAVYSAIKELIENGYCERIQENNGRFGKMDYYIHETPIGIKEILPQPGFPRAESTIAGNPALLSIDPIPSIEEENKEEGAKPPPPAPPPPFKPNPRTKIKEPYEEVCPKVFLTKTQVEGLEHFCSKERFTPEDMCRKLSTWKISKQVEGGTSDYGALMGWVKDALQKEIPVFGKGKRFEDGNLEILAKIEKAYPFHQHIRYGRDYIEFIKGQGSPREDVRRYICRDSGIILKKNEPRPPTRETIT